MEEKTAPPYRLYFRVNVAAVFQALGTENPQAETQHVEKPQLRELRKNEDAGIPHVEAPQVATPHSTCGKTTSQHAGKPHAITENTTETKTEITEREQAPGLPLIGLAPQKPALTDGRKQEGRKPNLTDDPELVSFRDRLKAHREATVGAPSGAQYFTQEAAGIKALWAKINAEQVTEADCLELFDFKLNQWRSRGMTGHLPNWLYVSQDIEPYIKNRNITPLATKRPTYVTQADINAPKGRLVM